MYPKKRGRKQKRERRSTAERYIDRALPPLRHWGGKSPSIATRSRKLGRSRDALLSKKTLMVFKEGDLIAVADAIVLMKDGQFHTWYFIFIRHVGENHARPMSPLYLEGKETVSGWSIAFGMLPADILDRVVALVCDGHTGFIREAQWRDWILQRCHAHLIIAIQGRRSRLASGNHREEGRVIDMLVRDILTSRDERGVYVSLRLLERMMAYTSSPQLRVILKGFLSTYGDFRSYLLYPELRLPTTNNTAESFNAIIGRLRTRAHGFRTIAALDKWICAIAKTRDAMKCNPGNQPNK